MNTLLKILYLFLIISFSSCINAEFQEIESMTKTEFDVNKDLQAYFKYKLGETKGPIGLHFYIANLYTVQVLIYKSPDDEVPFLTYFLAKEQFKEINTSEFEDYVYIVIKETYEYYYKDYITIYNPNEKIELKPGEPLTINNFLSNNKYEISFSSSENITLLYNTLNVENNQRKITIIKDGETIIDQGDESNYKYELFPGELTISVENFVQKGEDEIVPNQDFSLVVYENKKPYGFTSITKNKILKTNYIYNNEIQTFYYYADISDNHEYNSINFKLFFKYFLYNNNTKFYTNIIYLENEITDSDLEKNIPTENKLPYSYDVDSDEYFRIYFHDEKSDAKYKYLLVKVEIIENQYYLGSHNIEVSLGDEIKIVDLREIEYNNVTSLREQLIDYIPMYLKIELNPDEKYLLTSQNQDLTLFIIGDLINGNNEINENYLTSTNEIIIISGIEVLTIKLFGSSTNNIDFYIEKMNSAIFLFAENDRNNEIFEMEMAEEEVKYILGTYNYEKYAYGELPVNYYATADSGEFLVYYKDSISLESTKSLFPSQDSQLQELNKKISLDKNIDLFIIKCKKAGSMSIRPVSKKFPETTHLIEQNSVTQIELYDYTEVVQLSTPLGQNSGIVYFSILSVEKEKMTITSDTPGVFEEKTIQNNELFTGSADLSKYKMDQLAIRVKTASLEKDIEIIEIIHNKYNTYKKLEEGENKQITLNNIYIQINESIPKVNVTLENLQNKKISYGVIKSATNDDNYLTVANNYPNTTNKEIKENIEKIEVENIYIENKDEMKPYLYFVLSVLGEEDNLDYNVNISITEGGDDGSDDDHKEDGGEGEGKEDDSGISTILIVVICLFAAILIGFIALCIFMIVIKKRNANIEIEDISKTNQLTQNLTEVDP